MSQRTVDVHNHFYPKDYLAYLTTLTGRVRAKQTGPNSYVCIAGDVIVAHIDRPGHYDMAARIRDLDNAGLDTQIMSKTIPGPELLTPEDGIHWSKKINDALAVCARDNPGRIYAMATLPYQAPKEAAKELERCYKELGVKGIQMFSNCQGKPMFLPEFDDIFSMAEEYDLPILLHPTVPLTAPAMDLVKIPYQLYGYTVDSTLAVISCIFNGVFERHPKLRMIHSHLGGIAPYLVRRLNDSYKGYAKEWGLPTLSKAPDEYYKTQIWCDTCSFYLPAMRCCMDWVGAGHMMIGTDYAHRVGDPEGAIKSVRALGTAMDLPQDTVDLILGKNAEQLYKLPAYTKQAAAAQ